MSKKTLVFSFEGLSMGPGGAKSREKDESISNMVKLHVLMGGRIDKNGTETLIQGGKQPQKMHYYTSKLTVRQAKDDFKDAGYSKGDTLVVFGFSHGATLARKFADILARDYDCKVSFLCVFDTVCVVYSDDDYSDDADCRRNCWLLTDVHGGDRTLHQNIKRAVHIVSLDEDRTPFVPTLINKDADRILEVWFPGIHSDIGGGYRCDGLSDVALQFMIDECKKALGGCISIHQDNASICELFQEHGEALRGLDVNDIAIHPLPDGLMHKEDSGWWWAIERKTRKVYVSDNNECSKNDIPILHHSVKERFDKVTSYRPPALRGLRFRLLLENGRKSKVIQGISGLRALKLPTCT